MIKVSVMYPSGEGNTFDMEYYLNIHCPLSREVFGDALKGLEIDKGLGGFVPGSDPPYLVVGNLFFESVEAFMAVMTQDGARLLEDVPKYTNASAVVQISEVVT
ncbi:MAG: EthD family reductase [Bryobacteraceae bacterium]